MAGDPAGTDTLGTGNFVALGDPMPGVSVRAFSLRARGTFRPDVSGTWQLGIANAGKARVLLDGALVVDGRPLQAWNQLYGLSKSERQFVVKPSGFSELAWGSRGVHVAHHLTRDDRMADIDGGLSMLQ